MIGFLLLVTLFSLLDASGIYLEQAGVVDWHRMYFGRLIDAHWSEDSEVVYVASERRLLGALNATNGQVIWRQELPSDIIGTRVNGNTIQSVDSEFLLQDWDAATGALLSQKKSQSKPSEFHKLFYAAASGAFLKTDDCTVDKVIKKADKSLIMCTDWTLAMYSDDKLLWQRQESLANVTASAFVELPKEKVVLSNQRPHSTDLPLILRSLHRMFYRIVDGVRRIFESTHLVAQPHTSQLVTDQFGIRHLLVMGTSTGKVCAVLTDTGSIQWCHKNLGGPVKSIIDSSRLPNNEWTVAVVYSQVAGVSKMVTLQYLLGTEKSSASQPKVFKAAALLTLPNTHLMALTTNDGQVSVLPATSKTQLANHTESIVLHNVDVEKSVVTGFRLNQELKKTPAWTLHFPDEKIIGHSNHRADEKLASQGRVLGDRSVLYKYLNPNMITVATVVANPREHQTLTIYLIDSALGTILETVRHEDAVSFNGVYNPFHIVQCENWLVYFHWAWSTRVRTAGDRVAVPQLTVIDLYESSVPDLHIDAFFPPYLMMQSYNVPYGVTALGVTATQSGITTREVLVSTTNGGIQSISKKLLDPRRPYKAAGAMTADEKEEMLIPYAPMLEENPRETVSHVYPLVGISNIVTSPSLYESTTVVCTYGLDMFCTRQMPSKAFDILGPEFSRVGLIIVIGGLSVGILVCRHLAVKKKLAQEWK